MSDTIARKTPTIKYIFIHCNDLATTRRFYSELIGLAEMAFNDEWGFLNYKCDGFELMYFRSEKSDLPVEQRWAAQPGYQGGTLETTSWAIEVSDEDFATIVQKLRNAGLKLFAERPDWRQQSYWGFTVMDPNGVTVEVYCVPKSAPISTEWPVE
jgi:catechol 2,3-dioxygenase-like lactoylglutathione lyase family enzyme